MTFGSLGLRGILSCEDLIYVMDGYEERKDNFG